MSPLWRSSFVYCAICSKNVTWLLTWSHRVVITGRRSIISQWFAHFHIHRFINSFEWHLNKLALKRLVIPSIFEKKTYFAECEIIRRKMPKNDDVSLWMIRSFHEKHSVCPRGNNPQRSKNPRAWICINLHAQMDNPQIGVGPWLFTGLGWTPAEVN